MRKLWYAKHVGYCFNDNGKEVVLKAVFRYEKGKICYQLYYLATEETFIVDYAVF